MRYLRLLFLIGLLSGCRTFEIGFVPTPTLTQAVATASATTTTVPSPEQLPTLMATPAITSSLEIDSTADWKTYTNTKYRFTFKYPPTLNINKGPASDEPDEIFQTVSQISFLGTLILNDAASFIEFVIMAPEGTDPNIRCSDDQDCLDKFMTSSHALQAPIGARVKANILGRSVEGLEYYEPNLLHPGYSKITRYFVFTAKGQMWTAFAYFGLKSDQTQDPYARMFIFNRILATFEFLN